MRSKLAATVVAAALVVGGAACGDVDSDEGPTDYSAFEICKKFVKDRLKSPGSASFRNFFEDDGEVSVSGFGDGPYKVISTVDSENGFGALIRTDFVCEVKHTGDGNWRLLDIGMA